MTSIANADALTKNHRETYSGDHNTILYTLCYPVKGSFPAMDIVNRSGIVVEGISTVSDSNLPCGTMRLGQNYSSLLAHNATA